MNFDEHRSEFKTEKISLGSEKVAQDLSNLLKRIRSVDLKAAVRLQVQDDVLAVTVCTLAPETLLDSTLTVLGMRAIRLAQPVTERIDVVVESSTLLDRLARIEDENFWLSIPPTTVNAVWSGVQAPRTGWEEVSSVTVGELRSAGESGMKAVEGALPQNPGHAVVNTVRSRIWASPLETSQGTPNETIPTGAAFAALVLGFLPQSADDATPVRCFTSGAWVRLSLPAGYVLVRKNKSL